MPWPPNGSLNVSGSCLTIFRSVYYINIDIYRYIIRSLNFRKDSCLWVMNPMDTSKNRASEFLSSRQTSSTYLLMVSGSGAGDHLTKSPSACPSHSDDVHGVQKDEARVTVIVLSWTKGVGTKLWCPEDYRYRLCPTPSNYMNKKTSVVTGTAVV